MSKFLIKLKNEGKIKVIEPSGEVSESYVNKSDSHFESAKILLGSGKLEESVSMSYYGMYHLLLSLLFKCGIKCENHSAAILLLKEIFEHANLSKDINFAKKERIDKQYYTDFKLTKQECEDMIKRAESFILELKSIIRHLNEEKIELYRNRLQNILKQ